MGNARTQYRQLAMKPIPYSQVNHGQDIGDQAVKNAVADITGGGLISWTVSPTSPASMVVSAVINSAFSSLGEYLKKVAAIEVDLTTFIPASGYKWASIFATFAWLNADTVLDGNGNPAVPHRTESVTLTASNTGASAAGLPSNPGGGAVRICSIRLHSSTTQITSSMIKTTGRTAGVPNADRMYKTSELLPLAGGILTGSVMYQSGSSYFPLVYSNHGAVTFGNTILQLTDSLIPGISDYPDFNLHYLVQCERLVNTGIANNYMQFQMAMNIGIYNASNQTVATMWIEPKKIRHASDISANQMSEMLIALYHETDGVFTGDISVFALGSLNFVKRFQNKPFRWMAIAAMPYIPPLA